MCGFAVLANQRFISNEYSPYEVLLLLDEFLRTMTDWSWIVVAERWDSPGRNQPMTAQVDAIETNGAARWIASQYNATFGLQPRAEAKKVMTDATLRRLGWYVRTKDGHANDAARQLGLALLRHFPVEYMRLLEVV
jgi:hypothetical protein